MMRLSWIIPVAAAILLASSAAASELVMYRRAGCVWCAAWDREIGPIYANSDIGRRVPIRLVDLDQDQDATILRDAPVRFTPTFVLVEAGREAGRIEGYPGEHFFWGLLERLALRVQAQPAADVGPRVR
jgi:hypothetical protein